MAFVLEAVCHECLYTAGHLCVGNNEHFIIKCHYCHQVVNPKYIPFRFDYPTCPNCQGELDWYGYIYEQDMMLARKNEAVVPGYRCPRCLTGLLGFRGAVHVSTSFREVYPQVGEVVHGYLTEAGELRIPHLWLFTGQPWLKEASVKYHSYRAMELKVIEVVKERVDRKTDVPFVEWVRLEFVRYLHPEGVHSEGRVLRQRYQHIQPIVIEALTQIYHQLERLSETSKEQYSQEAQKIVVEMKTACRSARWSWPNVARLELIGMQTSYGYGEALRILHLEGGTPLAMVNGFAEMFTEEHFGRLTADQRQAFEAIIRYSNQVLTCWDQLFGHTALTR